MGRQWETMGDNGRQWETIGQRGAMRDNGKLWDPIIRTQWDIRPQNTIQKTPSKTGTHVGRQEETRPRQTDTWETMGGNGRQDLGKAGTPPNTGTHVGRQGETKAREAGPSIQQSEIRRETRRQGEPRPREGWRNINAGRQCNARQWSKDTPSNTDTQVWRHTKE